MYTLSNILKINAISSGTTGLGLVIFSKAVASLFAVGQQLPFIGIGLFLVVFSVFVFYNATQRPISQGQVKLIVMLDSLWVVGSATAILMLYGSVSPIGIFLIAAIALWVAAMAWLQFKGLLEGLQKGDS